MANTCLMLAVTTLYYFPSLAHCSFVFIVNFELVLTFDYSSSFSRFYYHQLFHYLTFYFCY